LVVTLPNRPPVVLTGLADMTAPEPEPATKPIRKKGATIHRG